jgi:Cu/Ag efflux protein CusF
VGRTYSATRCFYIATWVVILGLFFAASSAASGHAPLVTSSGQVASIDTKAKAMVVKFESRPGHATNVPFVVHKRTKVTKAGHRVGLTGIKPGDRIDVTFQIADGRSVAVRVGIESKRAA